MTTTTESKTEKRERLVARGYTPAEEDGTCGLCQRPLRAGQYARRMPVSWEPAKPDRHVHWRCHSALVAATKAKAAGHPAPLLPCQQPQPLLG